MQTLLRSMPLVSVALFALLACNDRPVVAPPPAASASAEGPVADASPVVLPTLRQGKTTVDGRLPVEVVERVVHEHFGEIQLCHEKALKNVSKHSGSVSVLFVIGDDGKVTSAKDDGSDLLDPAIVSCIVEEFSKLTFPPPQSGNVTVHYAIVSSTP